MHEPVASASRGLGRRAPIVFVLFQQASYACSKVGSPSCRLDQRLRRWLITALCAVIATVGALAGGAGAENSARAPANVRASAGALPQLWAVEIDAHLGFFLRRSQLRRMRGAGVNALVVDSSRLTRPLLRQIRQAAAQHDLRVVALIPSGTQARTKSGRELRAACRKTHRRAALLCGVPAPSPAAAESLARRSGPGDVVVLRLPGPRAAATLRAASGARPARDRAAEADGAARLPHFLLAERDRNREDDAGARPRRLCERPLEKGGARQLPRAARAGEGTGHKPAERPQCDGDGDRPVLGDARLGGGGRRQGCRLLRRLRELALPAQHERHDDDGDGTDLRHDLPVRGRGRRRGGQPFTAGAGLRPDERLHAGHAGAFHARQPEHLGHQPQLDPPQLEPLARQRRRRRLPLVFGRRAGGDDGRHQLQLPRSQLLEQPRQCRLHARRRRLRRRRQPLRPSLGRRGDGALRLAAASPAAWATTASASTWAAATATWAAATAASTASTWAATATATADRRHLRRRRRRHHRRRRRLWQMSS